MESKHGRTVRWGRYSYPVPLLYYVTDRLALGDSRFYRRVRQILEAGLDFIQLREKSSTTEEILGVAERLQRLPHTPHQKFLLNDRLDIAWACQFDGVHLGGHSFPLRTLWHRLPRNFLVGKSCHQLEEALEAERNGAHYVIFGPVFETPSKLNYGPPQGIAKLRNITEKLSIPVFAIGGITLQNAKSCLNAGAAGLAAISLFQTAPSISRVVKQLRSMVEPDR